MGRAHRWGESLRFEKRSNCFVEGSDLRAIDAPLRGCSHQARCSGWPRCANAGFTPACLCFGLTREEQARSEFRYQFSVFQIEYSRNFIFKSGRELDTYYQSLIERIWPALDVPRLKTIFGRNKRPHLNAGRGLEKRIEHAEHDLTVFKLKFSRLELKMYDKGARVLRIEMIARHVADLRCGRLLARISEMLGKMRDTLCNFLNVVQAVHGGHIEARQLDALPAPSACGAKRIAGVDLQKPRIQAVASAVMP